MNNDGDETKDYKSEYRSEYKSDNRSINLPSSFRTGRTQEPFFTPVPNKNINKVASVNKNNNNKVFDKAKSEDFNEKQLSQINENQPEEDDEEKVVKKEYSLIDLINQFDTPTNESLINKYRVIESVFYLIYLIFFTWVILIQIDITAYSRITSTTKNVFFTSMVQNHMDYDYNDFQQYFKTILNTFLSSQFLINVSQ